MLQDIQNIVGFSVIKNDLCSVNRKRDMAIFRKKIDFSTKSFKKDLEFFFRKIFILIYYSFASAEAILSTFSFFLIIFNAFDFCQKGNV